MEDKEKKHEFFIADIIGHLEDIVDSNHHYCNRKLP